MELENLKKYLEMFWTPEKCGKAGEPSEFIDQHDMILTKTLLVKPEYLLEQLNENTFNFQNFELIPWSDFLKRAKLAEYLQPDYIKYALEVTTGRPAIGRGEFLFVSCFSNLGFSKGRGDIVDMKSGKKCEFKGMRSTLSGDGKEYRQMNKSLIYSVFSLFNTGAEYDHFNRECAASVDDLLSEHPELLPKVLARLQNVYEPDMAFVREFGELYDLKKDLFNVVGAMQMCLYMKMQGASSIMFTNDEGFRCFEYPESAAEAYNIVKGLKLSSWMTGDYGMTIGM